MWLCLDHVFQPCAHTSVGCGQSRKAAFSSRSLPILRGVLRATFGASRVWGTTIREYSPIEQPTGCAICTTRWLFYSRRLFGFICVYSWLTILRRLVGDTLERHQIAANPALG